MLESWLVHYMNKYPDGDVDATPRVIIVRCSAGHKRVQIEKNAADMWVDMSEYRGCLDRHCLAPIPKEARAFKLYKDGKPGPAEEYAERIGRARALAAAPTGGPGRVPSNAELERASQPDAQAAAGPALAAPSAPPMPQPALEHNPAIPADFRRLADPVPAPLSVESLA